MGTLERRERERIALRQLILDAARDLFVQQGFEAVTMRKIAEQIDYSATAIYKHFEDKDALLRAILEEDFGALLAAMRGHAELSDPVERLMRQFDAYVRFALAHPDHYRLMFMTPKPHVVACDGDAPSTAYAYVRATVSECVVQDAFRAGLGNADALAQTLWAALHGLISLEMLRPLKGDIPWVSLEERLQLMREAFGPGLFRVPLPAPPRAPHA